MNSSNISHSLLSVICMLFWTWHDILVRYPCSISNWSAVKFSILLTIEAIAKFTDKHVAFPVIITQVNLCFANYSLKVGWFALTVNSCTAFGHHRLSILNTTNIWILHYFYQWAAQARSPSCYLIGINMELTDSYLNENLQDCNFKFTSNICGIYGTVKTELN